MKSKFISQGVRYLEEHKNSIIAKGFELSISNATIGRDNNSIGIDILSPLKSFSIIIWELGSLYFGGVNWEKDDAWNDNYTFETEEEMIHKLNEILMLL